MQTADYWIEKLEMQRHPEGGYFKETYKCVEDIEGNALPARFEGNRSMSTAIYFLLRKEDFSAFHKIKSDEIWHFYEGQRLEIFYFDENGKFETILLGRNSEKGEVFQAVVPANCWFGSRVASGSDYALVGCTVAPGFDFQDFEMAERDKLIADYPQFGEIILQLTH
ncbi:cupin domain-containing protein [Lacihabitans sp. LS3-19]|uniref:cupin domain-containing protein n=1 Tax=Lacihabitans sp. LS3-19 TaxID=2487335 RepID=UPI0020CD8695|nr:cupin domain-containing protein [Lacihabitans sp. LS3-19]MCP9768860.1 cupin domain-containing protein [Lacihabitans sp. LS3-19]